MRLEIDTTHAASGPYLFASGKKRPDSYRFERVKGAEHLHRYVVEDVNSAKAAEILQDLGLRLQQVDIPVTFRIVIEPKDLEGASTIAALQAEIRTSDERMAELAKQLAAARKKKGAEPKAETTGKITDEQVALLKERDELVELLAPFATEDTDTPVTVLAGIIVANEKATKKPGK